MIKYANSIASELKINPPNSDEYEVVSMFIGSNQAEYRRLTGRFIEDRRVSSIRKQIGEVSKKFIDQIEEIGSKSGIYFFWKNEKLMYIGKSSKNSRSRIVSSLEERLHQTKITHCSFCPIDQDSVHIEEMICISHYKPKLNSDGATENPSTIYRPSIDINQLKRIKIMD